jgi:hypothetical protein
MSAFLFRRYVWLLDKISEASRSGGISFDEISRKWEYDTLNDRQIYGIGTNLKTTTEFVTHKVKSNDTLNSLALKYYNNPTFWWVIAYFNDIQDAFRPLRDKYDTLKIPSISSIEFGRINK